ncbi:DUF3107 domain-containing protein [Agilicoccus flavus]|uniref:DUF3107 domain-containing protein n=1 Tax=Agilicoccus flavus TaxID=2775968 RepID=UPI001CF6B3F4|nr:DUF3107 domain-containing protein [Agilicoccus flavus]
MEVKIGVLHTGREITIESEAAPEEVERAVSDSVASGSPLRLVDAKGTVFLVPAAVVGYVEIGSARKGGVGFGNL